MNLNKYTLKKIFRLKKSALDITVKDLVRAGNISFNLEIKIS